MAKIQDKNKVYAFMKLIVDHSFLSTYRKVEYKHLDKIPKDGAVIFAANHTNALMDALAILAIGKSHKVFVARADIFKKPTVAKILRFIKIMPMHRIRDGWDALSNNDETIQNSVDTLQDKVPLCIMPEGAHRQMHSLLPLVKGVFRIALPTSELLKDKMPVYIVPIGIEYGSFFRYRSTLLLQIADSINVTDFVANHPELSQPEMMNTLRIKLRESLDTVTLNIPDDEYYKATLELCFINSTSKKSLYRRYQANKSLIEKLNELRECIPDKTLPLLNKIESFADKRKKLKISAESLSQKSFAAMAIRYIGASVLTLPLFLVVLVSQLPILLLFHLFTGKMKNKSFVNSFKMVIKAIIYPILLLLIFAILLFFIKWYLALVIVLYMNVSHRFLYIYRRWMRLGFSNLKLLFNNEIRIELEEIKREWNSIN